MKKQQVILIHGGQVFSSYNVYIQFLKDNWEYRLPREEAKKNWKESLQEHLPNLEFLFPRFPNPLNSKYEEWKIYFEKVLEKTDRELIFIGYSLGGTFLLKYLSEEKIKKEVMALFIVAANITSDHKGYQLDTFSLDFEKVKKIDVKNIFIFHSEDDDSVPFSDSNVLSGLLPDSKKFDFTDRGHFLQEDFPEIVQKIKELENE